MRASSSAEEEVALCPVCQGHSGFKSSEELFAHLTEDHQLIKCGSCEEDVFLRPQDMQDHIHESHLVLAGGSKRTIFSTKVEESSAAKRPKLAAEDVAGGDTVEWQALDVEKKDDDDSTIKRPKMQAGSSEVGEKGTKKVADLTVGEYAIPDKYSRDPLVGFWTAAIMECLECPERPSRKFNSQNAWFQHIRVSHPNMQKVSEYRAVHGDPDITRYRHRCLLCGACFILNGGVARKHFLHKHGIDLESYMNRFRESLLREKRARPVMPSFHTLDGWWEGCLYSCRLCGSTLSNAPSFEHHLALIHKIIGLAQIEECYVRVHGKICTLLRFHRCYLCNRLMRHEYKTVYQHMLRHANYDLEKYAKQFETQLRKELEEKKMEYIMDREKEILSSPTLDQFLARQRRQSEGLESFDIMQEWYDGSEHQCAICREVLFSNLKFHSHIRRLHSISNMKAYRDRHGDPERRLRQHQCQICKRLVKWEASRIRDHLKMSHKKAEDCLSLAQYGAMFKDYIVAELRKFKFREQAASNVTEEIGGGEGGFSHEEWREMLRRKQSGKDRLGCPYCEREFNRSSLNKHIDRFHVGRDDNNGLRGEGEKVLVVADDADGLEEEKQEVGDGEGDGHVAYDHVTGDQKESLDDPLEERGGLKITRLSAVNNRSEVQDQDIYTPEVDTSTSYPTYVVDQETGEILMLENEEGALQLLEQEEEELELEMMQKEVEREIVLNRNYIVWDSKWGSRPNPESGSRHQEVAANDTADISCEPSTEDVIFENYAVIRDDESLDSEYDEGPLDGKIMKIYLPDVTPIITTDREGEEKEEDVTIVKLETVMNEEDSEEDEGEPEQLILQEQAEEEQQAMEAFAPPTGRESVIVKPCLVGIKSATGLGSSEVAGGLENHTGDTDGTGEQEQEEVLQILEIVAGQHGGLQQITVVASGCGDNDGNDIGRSQDIFSDRIRELLNNWEANGGLNQPEDHPHVHEASEVDQLTYGGETEGSALKILELQVVDSIERNQTLPRRIVFSNEALRKVVAAAQKQHQSQNDPKQPACKAALLAARQSYTKKKISRCVEHLAQGRKSTGTQASTWTKMPEDRVKVARHKVIRPRAHVVLAASQMNEEKSAGALLKIEASGRENSSDNLLRSIAAAEVSADKQRRSIGTQVVHAVGRGLVDDEEDHLQKDAIVSYIESGQLLDRSCPGCGKVLANMKNLFRHLETKHEIRLAGSEAETRKEQFTRENMLVQCHLCFISINRKSMKRHLRIMHNKVEK